MRKMTENEAKIMLIVVGFLILFFAYNVGKSIVNQRYKMDKCVVEEFEKNQGQSQASLRDYCEAKIRRARHGDTNEMDST